MTDDGLHELTAAYALDALSEDERSDFEAHLTTCERCRAELASLEDAVGALAFAPDGPEPPADLRDRIVLEARRNPGNVVALRPSRRRLYAATAVAAAACTGLAIGLWAGLSGGSSRPRLALTLRPSGAAQLSVSGLDPAPAGKVYEVWVIEGAKTLPAGFFSKSGSVRLTRSVPSGSVVAVTLERPPGRRRPTPPILVQTTASV